MFLTVPTIEEVFESFWTNLFTSDTLLAYAD